MNNATNYQFLATTGDPVILAAADEEHAHAEESTGHSTESGHGEESGGLSSFGLDPLAFALQLGAIIIFYFLFRKFALKKVAGILDERHTTIEKSLSDAKQIAIDVELANEKQAALLTEARTEAEVIMTDAQKEAGSIIKAAEERAAQKVDGMIADAHARIADDITKAKKDLEGEVATLVAEATEAIIGEKLTGAKDQALIKKALGAQK